MFTFLVDTKLLELEIFITSCSISFSRFCKKKITVKLPVQAEPVQSSQRPQRLGDDLQLVVAQVQGAQLVRQGPADTSYVV